MSLSYLVIAEIKHNKLRQVTVEAIEAARILSDQQSVGIVVIGSNVQGIADQLTHYVEQPVIVIEQDELGHYTADHYINVLVPLIEQLKPKGIILGHTALGKDLAPRLAASFKAGQISDVIEIVSSTNPATLTRPIYAGKALEHKQFNGDKLQVITIRPSNIAPAVALSATTHTEPFISHLTDPLRVKIHNVVQNVSGKVDLAEAKIIVSGGRGVKSKEGFAPLEQLAELLGGAVGASRGACDAGYCDYALQIGQTGKVVTPELYIACGISGAIQHLAGMSSSKVIIAINKDPEAPIFKIADYGIVGDLFEVVPLLTEELKLSISR